MELKNLIEELDVIEIKGSLDLDITSVCYNSRQAIEGSVFVAISGFSVDGHNFIGQAIKNGAKALFVEKDVSLIEDITIIKVSNARFALAKISSNFYGNPSSELNLIGITGTNGKTSTTYLIKSIFEQAKMNSGLIGTIGNIIGNEFINTKNTTPESLELQKMFRHMKDKCFDSCVMEVSSHSLELNRVDCCDFDIALFTNLSRDHMDLHKNMENYLNAKVKLFNMSNKYNIVNIDDPHSNELIEKIDNSKAKLLAYGVNSMADIYATDISYSPRGVDYIVHTPKGNIDIHVNIPGLIYVYNSLAAISCAYACNISLEEIKAGISDVKGVRGRFEVVPTNTDYTVIIDYAHTGDGLQKALDTIDLFAKGRKIVVFGAGGEKGKDKRWDMGSVAGKNCDLSIVTSDNPKREDPKAIMTQITEAIKKENGKYVEIIDRKKAIEYALKIAQPNDIILLAGKGHETEQIIGTEVFHFDEREIVLEMLNKRKMA
ncbi:UDP-N-acetylmuramoyl-L-alanyl-D-glutamate--2,6-diaminopimelate ligase [Brassicibacter mesophilus]|uniref:UDP-N-acetylmuramoyl-L-alanyl-D-glutamate--2, 6-diaminopimelate ligase n=1 Tax=Brassicibacter mesophilus TaxID=745119 RepID=UPI003D1D8CAD